MPITAYRTRNVIQAEQKRIEAREAMDRPTPEDIAAELRAFERRPLSELRQVHKALRLHPWLNNRAENARLIAVGTILRHRNAR